MQLLLSLLNVVFIFIVDMENIVINHYFHPKCHFGCPHQCGNSISVINTILIIVSNTIIVIMINMEKPFLSCGQSFVFIAIFIAF